MSSEGGADTALREDTCVVGTMNFLGDDQNPLQFMPSQKDIELAGMSVSEWESADQEAAAPYYSYTVGQARAHFTDVVQKSFAATTTTTVTAHAEFSTTLRGTKCLEIFEAFLTDVKLQDSDCVAALCKSRARSPPGQQVACLVCQ